MLAHVRENFTRSEYGLKNRVIHYITLVVFFIHIGVWLQTNTALFLPSIVP